MAERRARAAAFDVGAGALSPLNATGATKVGSARRVALGSLDELQPLVGDWQVFADLGGMPSLDGRAAVRFEWLPGRRFLVQRWLVPDRAAPDGIAVIGADPEREGAYLQHYFDSHGAARVYRMSFADGIWRLWRDSCDFSPLDLSQRYSGTLSEGGDTIAGAWEVQWPGGPWELDYTLTYTRV